MSHLIGFPGLFDRAFEIDRVAFTVFGKDVMWYGVIIACGFLLAAFYAIRRAPQFRTSEDEFTDLLLLGLPAAVIGCRAYFVLNTWDYYSAHPEEIIAIWNGGLGMYGGIAAAVLVVLIYGKRHHCNVRGIADLVALGFLIGQCIGRWGNFINAEAFGCATSLPWGMTIDGAAPCHPTFLYESLWTGIGFLVLHFYSKKRRFDGEIALLAAGWYGLARFWLEDLRTDSLIIGHTGISASKVVGGCCVLLCWGLLLYFRLSGRTPKPWTPPAAKAADAPEAVEAPASETAEESPEAAEAPQESETPPQEPEAPKQEPEESETADSDGGQAQ